MPLFGINKQTHPMKPYHYILTLAIMLSACRSDIVLYPSESEQVADSTAATGAMYLLCEGNMGSNKCTLDRLDLKIGQYTRNFYGAANPNVTKELGDVGNDLQVYGKKLWAVVNGSNKIEVMDATSGVRLGQVELANCRHITFHQGYAYATSYAGPIGTGHTQRGFVAKIDTTSLSIVDTCLVGYQPNGLAVSNGQLFVANSGGYMAPNYERHLSVIDLYTFSVTADIDVAPNLNHIVADAYGQLWVSSHGDDLQAAGSLHCVDAAMRQVTRTLPIGVNSMWLSGDSLYVTGYSRTKLYGIVNVKERQLLTDNFISDGSGQEIQKPYGISVHPTTGDIYVTDAKNYVVPGTLHCYDRQGKHKWSVRTGDIPSCMAFYMGNTSGNVAEEEEVTDDAYANTVFEYRPAPGQFINILPTYEAGDTHESMCRKAEEALANGARGMVSLGGWGGFITLGFSHIVPNVAGENDLQILGNAHYNSTDTGEGRQAGSAEPGIIQVSYDANGNGLPDDPWYEIHGSHHGGEAITDYSITYRQPTRPQDDIQWQDNQEKNGTITHNSYHAQSYYPAWVSEAQLTFHGTCLPPNTQKEGNQMISYSYDYGYADNHANDSPRSCIDIDWAMDENGQPAQLKGIHFVRIYTGTNLQNGSTGETSTEVCGAINLHYMKSFTNFVKSKH